MLALLAGTASLPWFWVLFNAGGVEKQLQLSGFEALPMVTAQVGLGALGLLALVLLRGKLRTGFAYGLAAVTLAISFANFQNVIGNWGQIPPKLNTMIEKASGISGGGTSGASASVEDFSSSGTLGIAFLTLSVALAVTFVLAGLRGRAWALTEKSDKYVRPSKSAARAANTAVTPANTKGDNISLWDSQR